MSSVPHSVRSQFFLTFKSCAHLDGKHVVFGKLVLLTLPCPQRSRYRLGTHDAVRGFGLGVKRRSTRQAGVHVARCASMATGRGRRTRRVLERTIGCVQTAGWSVLEAIELLGSESGTPSSRVVRPNPHHCSCTAMSFTQSRILRVLSGNATSTVAAVAHCGVLLQEYCSALHSLLSRAVDSIGYAVHGVNGAGHRRVRRASHRK